MVRSADEPFQSYQQRKALEHCCHGAFFFAIVIVQWADLIVARTRAVSLVSHGFSNLVLNLGMLSTLLLSYFFLYIPYVQDVFGLTGLRCGAPFLTNPRLQNPLVHGGRALRLVPGGLRRDAPHGHPPQPHRLGLPRDLLLSAGPECRSPFRDNVYGPNVRLTYPHGR